jgi:uncharacterized protein (TIGR03437 family)
MRFVLFLLTAALSIAGEFTTSLGDANSYTISAITTDSAGNTYVVGSRALAGIPSTIAIIGDFSSPNPFESPVASDVFVTKLDPNGKILFTDTFAGKGVDTGSAIAVDPSGNIYIAGTTTSPDFPLSKALQTQPNTTYGTGFIIKLSNDGSTILYSTYFGGTLGQTFFTSAATDSSGNLFLTGATGAADFPHTSGMPSGPTGTILLSISAAGDKILYSGTVTGGKGVIPVAGAFNNDVGGVSVAVDAAGNAYFAGNTGANNLPTTPGVLGPTGFSTGFLAKVNAGTTGLSYLTYLPGNVFTMAVDAVGNAYIPGFRQTSLTKINSSATAIVWNGNLGGPAQSLAVDANGNAWAVGSASSTFLNTNGWTTGPEFLAGLNAAGSKLTYSALYPSGTVAQSVAVDPSGFVHVAGLSGFVSVIAPNTAPSMKIFGFQNAAGGSVTARISPAEVISIYGPGIGASTPATAAPSGGFYPKTLAGVQVTINGMNMPLLYVSANQINAVVPMELAPRAAATVRVINGSAVSPDYPVWIDASAPQAFPTVLNQDGTINSQTNPAKSGSTITFYGTGWQSSFSPLADGQVATAAQDACMGACYLEANSFFIISTVDVLYAGTAPGIVAGVSQFNIRFGDITGGSGQNTVNLLVGGPASLILTVWAAP